MKFYELKLDGDNLIATPCEEFDPYSKEIKVYIEPKYFGGKTIYALFIKKDSGYQIAWGQDIFLYRGKIYFVLNDSEDFNSKNPIDRFSWEEDENREIPQHKIILESR